MLKPTAVPTCRWTPTEACQLYGTCASGTISCELIAGRKQPGALFSAWQVPAWIAAKLGIDFRYGVPAGALNGFEAKSARPSFTNCGSSWLPHDAAHSDG